MDKREEQELRALDVRYAGLRPGADEFTDSAYAADKEEIRNKFTQMRGDLIAGTTRAAEDRFVQRQNEALQFVQNLDQQEFSQLASIAQQDIDQIAGQLNIDRESANFIKQTFANLGSNLVLSQFDAQPLDRFSGGVPVTP